MELKERSNDLYEIKKGQSERRVVLERDSGQ